MKDKERHDVLLLISLNLVNSIHIVALVPITNNYCM